MAAVEQQDQRPNGREAANVVWALATLEVCVGLLAHVLDAKARSQVPLLGRAHVPFPIASVKSLL